MQIQAVTSDGNLVELKADDINAILAIMDVIHWHIHEGHYYRATGFCKCLKYR